MFKDEKKVEGLPGKKWSDPFWVEEDYDRDDDAFEFNADLFFQQVKGKKIRWSGWMVNKLYFVPDLLSGSSTMRGLSGSSTMRGVVFIERDGRALDMGCRFFRCGSGFGRDLQGGYWEFYKNDNIQIEKISEDDMRKSVIENFKKTEDAVLVDEQFPTFLEDAFIESLIVKTYRDEILDEANRRADVYEICE